MITSAIIVVEDTVMVCRRGLVDYHDDVVLAAIKEYYENLRG